MVSNERKKLSWIILVLKFTKRQVQRHLNFDCLILLKASWASGYCFNFEVLKFKPPGSSTVSAEEGVAGSAGEASGPETLIHQ